MITAVKPPEAAVRKKTHAVLLSATWLTIALAACGSSSSDPTPTPPPPPPPPPSATIALHLTSNSVSIDQDDDGVVSGTITRGGNYSGDVTISVSGTPLGVTAASQTLAGESSSATVQLHVASSTAEGAYSLVVRASGTGVPPDSGTVVLTVIPAVTSSVGVTLGSSILAIASSTQATAVVRDPRGTTIVRDISWGSSNPAVATITAGGLVTAIAPGTAVVSANAEGIVGSAQLTVSPPAVGSVNVSLSAPSLVAGSKGAATATVRDNSGSILVGRGVVWTSSNPAVATVDSTGAISAVVPGTAAITASSGGVSGSSLLTVTAPGPSSVTVTIANPAVTVGSITSATGVVRDINGSVLIGSPVIWSSSSPSIASITSLGIITAIAPGTTSITGTSGGLSGTALLTVTPAPVSTVTVSLGSSTVSPGSSTQATAITRDALGNTLIGRTVTWGSSNQSVATVSATGLVTTLSIGAVTITATSEGKSGVASLTVSQPTPAGATAICKDGTYSYSATRSGTCSHHGGVAIWL